MTTVADIPAREVSVTELGSWHLVRVRVPAGTPTHLIKRIAANHISRTNRLAVGPTDVRVVGEQRGIGADVSHDRILVEVNR